MINLTNSIIRTHKGILEGLSGPSFTCRVHSLHIFDWDEKLQKKPVTTNLKPKIQLPLTPHNRQKNVRIDRRPTGRTFRELIQVTCVTLVVVSLSTDKLHVTFTYCVIGYIVYRSSQVQPDTYKLKRDSHSEIHTFLRKST